MLAKAPFSEEKGAFLLGFLVTAFSAGELFKQHREGIDQKAKCEVSRRVQEIEREACDGCRNRSPKIKPPHERDHRGTEHAEDKPV